MNAPFVVAQAGGRAPTGTPVRVVKVTKPQSGEALTFQLSYDQSVKLDLTAIAGEKITLVHIGERLVILFDNRSTVTVEPYFDSTGQPLRNITVEVAQDRIVTGNEFITLFPITTDQAVLPAAGDQTPLGSARFLNESVDPLNAPNPLPLLPQEELPNWQIQIETKQIVEGPPPLVQVGKFDGVVEEEQNPESEGSGSASFIIEQDGKDCVECETQGIEDTVDFTDDPIVPGNDEFDHDTENNHHITNNYISGSLAGLVGGGVPPYAFSIVNLVGQVVKDSDGADLKSHGEVVTYQNLSSGAGVIEIEGWTGFANGDNEADCEPRHIFTIRLNEDGTFDFILFDRVDHLSLDGLTGDDLENILKIDLTPLLHVEDNIGQTLTFSGDSFLITVIDDVPEASNEAPDYPQQYYYPNIDSSDSQIESENGSPTLSVALDDEDIEDLNSPGIDGGPGDDGYGSKLCNGQLDVDYGRDGPSKFEAIYDEDEEEEDIVGFEGINPLVFSDNISDVIVTANNVDQDPIDLQAVYVDGDGHADGNPREVFLKWEDAPGGGGTLIGYALIDENADTAYNPDDENQFKVFTLEVDCHGSYDFKLLAPLWHPATDVDGSNDGPETEYEDNITINLPFTITDFDGDQKTAMMSIEVDDDSPDLYVTQQDGSGTWHDSSDGEGYGYYSKLPLLNLDETTDPDVDGGRDGDDTYNGAEPQDGNGDLDDVDGDGNPDAPHVFNQTPDPTGNDPIGRLETAAGYVDEYEDDEYVPSDVEAMFNIDAKPGADGLQSLTHDLDLILQDHQGKPTSQGVRTTMRVTQPAEDGNPDIDGLTPAFEQYDEPTIYLVQVGDEIWGVVDEPNGVGPFGPGNLPDNDIALKIKLVFTDPSDLGTAKLVVEQYMAIDHGSDGNQFDTQLPLFINGEDYYGYSLGLKLQSTIKDGDNDTQISEPVTVTLISDDSGEEFDPITFVAIDDDGPRILSIETEVSVAEAAALELNLDETIGADRYNLLVDLDGEQESHDGNPATNDQDSNGETDDTNYDVPVLFTDLSTGEADENFGQLATKVEGGLGALFGSAVVDYGTDGQGADLTESFSLVLKGVTEGAGVKTNLVATEIDALANAGLSALANREIWMFLEGDTIVGRIGQNDQDSTNDYIVFTIAIEDVDLDPSVDDWQLVVRQYLPIDHDTSEPASQQNPETPSLFDEQIDLLAAVAGEGVQLKMTVVATDGDGDVVENSAALDLVTDTASFLAFDDDGLSDAGVEITAGSIIHDETAGVQNAAADGDAPGDTVEEHDVANMPVVFAPHFEPLGGVFAEDNLTEADAIGFAYNDTALTLDRPISAFGTDGPHPDNAITMSFVLPDENIIAPSTATNLHDTATGNRIFLYVGDNVLIGRVGFSDDINTGADLNGAISFAMAIEYTDPATAVSMVQFRAIQHGDPTSNDEGIDLKIVEYGYNNEVVEIGGLKVKAVVMDGDNDVAELFTSNFLQVTFEDDGPSVTGNNGEPLVIECSDCNLVQNGSFELGHGLVGSDWDIYTSIPGWTQGADGVPFEIQTGGIGGLAPQDGNALVELDADTVPNHGSDFYDGSDTNAMIQQLIATDTGQTYELTFWYAPRPNDGNADSSDMRVLWDGVEVHKINSVSDGWQQITVQVTATGANSVLAFQGLGQENELGAFIDNVSLCAVGDSLGGGSGDLGIIWGADNADVADGDLLQDGAGTLGGLTGRHVTFTSNDIGIDGIDTPLTSCGDVVSVVLAKDETVLRGVVEQDGDDRLVFEVKLFDDGSGSYSFDLFDKLDLGESDITLGFDFTATDGDGDTAAGNFAVTVDSSCACQIELAKIENPQVA